MTACAVRFSFRFDGNASYEQPALRRNHHLISAELNFTDSIEKHFSVNALARYGYSGRAIEVVNPDIIQIIHDRRVPATVA